MARRPPSLTLDLFRARNRLDHHTRWRAWQDRARQKTGISWQTAPVRRCIQALCLLLYFDLFLRVCWPYGERFSGLVLPDKEYAPVEAFLWIDPLVGLSTAIAARWWNVALIGMAAILLTGVVFPRGFCGYLCPLGTLIDLFDFVVGKRVCRPRVQRQGCWVNLRFYLLGAVLAAAVGGVLISGLVAAIPVLTRGLLFSVGNAQLGLLKNWGMVPPPTPAVWISLALFAAVFLLGLLGPRFWCRYVCPSGALLSVSALVRRFKRQVDDRCISCGECLEVCPFDAIQPDFGTRTLHCTFCQTCGGVCPAEAIHFVPLASCSSAARSDVGLGKPLSRRAMLGSVAGGAATAMMTRFVSTPSTRPVRPPGSVIEDRFLDLCIRCEQCIKVCPGPVLQAAGLAHGLESLWTPVAVFPHAGCHQDCHFCTQVCPTGAIRPIALPDKRRFVMGLAVVNAAICLPHRGERDCQLCFDECNAAGYRAIEMRPVKLAAGEVPEGMFSPEETEQMGQILAPFVKAEACVGCGLCEYRCHSALVGQQKLLTQRAVVVRAPWGSI
jgi:ferredoxin